MKRRPLYKNPNLFAFAGHLCLYVLFSLFLWKDHEAFNDGKTLFRDLLFMNFFALFISFFLPEKRTSFLIMQLVLIVSAIIILFKN